MQAHIAQLWTYPIKSCAGVALLTAQALSTGLAHDRSFMVVQADTGQMVSQRTHPRMALIVPHVAAGVLQVIAPAMAALAVRWDGEWFAKTVTVWRDTFPAWDMGDAAAQWFSTVLNTAVRLVRFDTTQKRRAHRAAPLMPLKAAAHHFGDGYPYLVLSQASVDALNVRLLEAGANAIHADRFRPNIVIAGVDAHTEDYAIALHHASGAALHMVSPCTRCTVPTVDQGTGIPSLTHQPTAALSHYRVDAQEGGIVFGMNAQLSLPDHQPSAVWCVGDTLRVVLAF